jgi:hypothetical protein
MTATNSKALFEMADFFAHNAPDLGEDGTLLGPPGTSIADKFRRAALVMVMQGQRMVQDTLHTLFPSIGPTGATGGHSVGLPLASLKNVGGDWSSLAGQYVGPKDMIAHKSFPGYIPQQDWQNAVKQDPLAGLLGPMQKPAPRQPEPTSGF